MPLRGLILEPKEVARQKNEIKAIPDLIQKLAWHGVVFTFDAINTKKTCELIVESSNDYIGALKGNQPSLLRDVKANFTPESTYEQINSCHGQIDARKISICQTLDDISWLLSDNFNSSRIRTSSAETSLLLKSKPRHVITSLH